MSTPAPAPETSAAEEEKFDPNNFPQDLRAAQLHAAKLYAELHAHQKTLPWSRDPHPGWPEEKERGREHPERPETPGWTDEQAAEYDRLFAALREATAAVQGHKHWKDSREHGVQGADMVALRQALKHAEGAVPLRQEDVEQTA